MAVYKFGMNKSCFGKGLWAFLLCFEKDEFVFFGDFQVGLCKNVAYFVEVVILNRDTVYLYGGGYSLGDAVKSQDFLGSCARVHFQIASDVRCRFGGGRIRWD